MRVTACFLCVVIGCASAPAEDLISEPETVLEPTAGGDAIILPPIVIPRPTSAPACAHPPTVSWSDRDFANAAEFDAPCIVEQLDPDGCVGGRTLNEFDARGLLVRSELQVIDPVVFRPNYGDPMSTITTWRHDDAGRTVARAVDLDADGTIDDSTTIEYDSAGLRVRERRRTRDHDVSETWRYDDRGRVFRHEQTATPLTGADPVRSFVVHSRYEGDHKVIEQMDADGATAAVKTWTFDADGRPLEEQSWTPARSEGTRYQYDARGLAVREWYRNAIANGEEAPGLIERHTFSRREDGTPVSELYQSIQARTGRVTKTKRTTFDFAGRELRAEWDQGADGVVDSFRELEWDDNGHRTKMRTVMDGEVRYDVRFRHNAAGQLLEQRDLLRGLVTTVVYDASGRPVLGETRSLDGALLRRNVNEYPSRFRTLVLTDTDGDGDVDQRRETFVDEGDRVIRGRFDQDGDGVWDSGSRTYRDRAGQALYSYAYSGPEHTAPRRGQVLSSWQCRLPRGE